jgi:hypothetical protein
VALVTVVVAVVGLAGCSAPAAPTAAPGSTPSGVAPPATASLEATSVTSAGATAVVAMGTLSDPLNTFWQLFVRPPAATAWTLVTPPGVADNGGLVVSTGPRSDRAAGPVLLSGFEPSQDLAFSPLARSADGGGSWSPGLLPAVLAAVPDALAVAGSGPDYALVRAGGGEVLQSAGGISTWSKLVGRAGLASSPEGRSCRPGDLTAVAPDPAGGALVATTCASSGAAGIFADVGGTWRLVGPVLGGRLGPTTVLRLVGVVGGTAGLVAVSSARGEALVAVARAAGAPWSSSAPMALGPGGHVVSTGVGSGGGFVVLVARPRSPLELDAETGPAGAWRALPPPPSGTAAVAAGPGGLVDALAVASTVFTDWRLDPASGTWVKIASMSVPIEFGSSS